MADSSRERDSLFKKCVGKLSEKYHRSFLLDLASIYLGLKPSLLFDYTVVDATNASILIDALVLERVVPYALDVLRVGDDIFFADFKYLVRHLKTSLELEELIFIDVSGALSEPRLLQSDASKSIYKQLSKIVDILDQKIGNQRSNETRSGSVIRKSEVIDLNICKSDASMWCIPCIFGFLLRYPVIYWCNDQGTCTDCNCLSMVPLNRYTVTVKESFLIHSWLMKHNSGFIQVLRRGTKSCSEHVVFSFSAPVALQSCYESDVEKWMKKIYDSGGELETGEHLKVQKTVLSLPHLAL
ncbi:UPF0739 protein C1orf74 homolog [Stylophora pistillata]|uniref:UPF0739 protein C1orf74 homolog n=1 Tax=Stylophora pistillata TaxID=50429 RepID=UPI000C04D1C9|nr:UPF0739 protein C1orf74 homolog [Stylophora pistillata]